MGYIDKDKLTYYDLEKLAYLEQKHHGVEAYHYFHPDSVIYQHFEQAKKIPLPKPEPFKHHKHHCKGVVNLYGNSIQLKENYDLGSFGQKMFDRLQTIKGKSVLDLEAADELKELIEQNFQESKNQAPPKREQGDIKRFSKKSYLNLTKKLNRVDFTNKKQPFFVTLTYPSRYPTDKAEYKSDLDAFFKRLKRRFGDIAYVWKLEAHKKRPAPHFHLILFLKQQIKIEYFRKWVSKNWFEVAQRNWDIKLEEHLKAGTNVKYKPALQLRRYVSKYISKQEDDGLINQGRYWGASRNWEDKIIEDFEITAKQMIVLKRLTKKYIDGKNKKFKNLISKNENIEVWGSYRFFIDALMWVIHNY